jgi:hypothetical protein
LNYALNYVAVRKIIKKYKKLTGNDPVKSLRVNYLKYKMMKWHLKVLLLLNKSDIIEYAKSIPECFRLPTYCSECQRLLIGVVYTDKNNKFICLLCYKIETYQILFEKFTYVNF